MEKFCSFFCSVDKYGPLILLSVQYMVEPFCLTNFSATSHSTHPVPAVPSQAGRKSEPFLSFFISIWLYSVAHPIVRYILTNIFLNFCGSWWAGPVATYCLSRSRKYRNKTLQNLHARSDAQRCTLPASKRDQKLGRKAPKIDPNRFLCH